MDVENPVVSIKSFYVGLQPNSTGGFRLEKRRGLT